MYEPESPQDSVEPSKPSYEELEAQASAMRDALEDVWSVCSKTHWQQVGEALKPDAGKRILEELEKARYERDLLRHPLQDIVPFLDRHDQDVILSRNPAEPVPKDDEDCIELEVQLGVLRDARKALQAVEATPEKISRMKEALEQIEAYSKYLSEDAGTIECKTTELRILSEEIPYMAYKALLFSSLPQSPDIVVDERLAEARRYEKALREIATRAADFSQEQPGEEISHALIVEIPNDATDALYPEDRSAPKPTRTHPTRTRPTPVVFFRRPPMEKERRPLSQTSTCWTAAAGNAGRQRAPSWATSSSSQTPKRRAEPARSASPTTGAKTPASRPPAGGSFHLGDGYTSFSGSLNPVVPLEKLIDTGEIRQGRFWFFSGDWPRANNSVDVEAPCRVYRYSEEIDEQRYDRKVEPGE